MGRFVGVLPGRGNSGASAVQGFAPHPFFLFGVSKMNAHIKSYLWFVGFLAVTKIVVAPIAKNLNIPLVSDIVG